MAGWIVPTFAYVLLIGALGVVSKLALGSLGWPTLIFWTTLGYAAITVVLLVLGEVEIAGPGTGWAIATAALAIGGLIALYIALASGDASKVAPIAAAYPIVTVLLAAVALSETVSPLRYAGALVVVIGVAMVGAAS